MGFRHVLRRGFFQNDDLENFEIDIENSLR